MNNVKDFEQFYAENKKFFNLFEDLPIKGILKSVWQKKNLENEKDHLKLQQENEQLKILKGEAEAKLDARNSEIIRKNQINISIIEQQKFFTEEAEELKNKKNIALNTANIAMKKVEKYKKEKKVFQDRVTILNLHITKQDKAIDLLKNKHQIEINSLQLEKQELKAELDKLLYEKEELGSYAKNYKQLNNKLSNEVFRLSQRLDH